MISLITYTLITSKPVPRYVHAIMLQVPKPVRVMCFSSEIEYSTLFYDLRSPPSSSLDIEALDDISFGSIACFDPAKMANLPEAGKRENVVINGTKNYS